MRKPGSLVPKDPDSTEPMGIDWATKWLPELGPGVAISTSTWTITGPDTALTKSNESILNGEKTQAYFTGGTSGKKYTVTNRVVTNSAPAVTDDRSFQFLVIQR